MFSYGRKIIILIYVNLRRARKWASKLRWSLVMVQKVQAQPTQNKTYQHRNSSTTTAVKAPELGLQVGRGLSRLFPRNTAQVIKTGAMEAPKLGPGKYGPFPTGTERVKLPVEQVRHQNWGFRKEGWGLSQSLPICIIVKSSPVIVLQSRLNCCNLYTPYKGTANTAHYLPLYIK